MKPARMLLFGCACFAVGIFTGRQWSPDASQRLPDAPPQAAKSSPPGERQRLPRYSSGPGNPGRERGATHSMEAGKDGDSANPQAEVRADRQLEPLVGEALKSGSESDFKLAIEAIQQSLKSTDRAAILAGLSGLAALPDIPSVSGALREALEPHLRSEDEAVRRRAWHGLIRCGLEEGDLRLLRDLVRSPGFGETTTHLLVLAEKGDLTGESGDIVLDLLRSGPPGSQQSVLRGTLGAALSPELEAEIISLSHREELEHDAIYYALSTQANKSPETVGRLIEALRHPDNFNVGGRAAWGLQQGVLEGSRPRVAEAALEMLARGTNHGIGQECWTLVWLHANRENLQKLRELASTPSAVGDNLSKLKLLIADLENTEAQ